MSDARQLCAFPGCQSFAPQGRMFCLVHHAGVAAPQVKDGPHLMHDPAAPPDEDGVHYGQLANVVTSESGARIVSDGQRVYVLDDLLRRGYVFVPLVAMTAARVAALEILLDPDFVDADQQARAHVTILAMLREVSE
jgi:hypothetical protein